ncbi:MAG TPA: DUF86 domain-containing protein [Candidatus Hydrogenedentes bacterium]|nr:DUF86 domain-containing protein [Candidatus Hydrogenedentota bacterium]
MLRDADITRLRHMVEAIREILEFVHGRDQQSLLCERPIQHLVLRNLEILGEAASRLSPECRQQYPEIPWRDMIDLRNRLVHVYFDLNLDIIWSTVQQDLPELLSSLEAFLQDEAAE